MTRNRFNQGKHQSGNPLLGSTSTNNLTLIKARGLFLEDNDNSGLKDIYKITNVHPPIVKMLLRKSIVTITYYHLIIE